MHSDGTYTQRKAENDKEHQTTFEELIMNAEKRLRESRKLGAGKSKALEKREDKKKRI